MIVVDTGPLVAMANEQDRHHARCVDWFDSAPRPLLMPAPTSRRSAISLSASVALPWKPHSCVQSEACGCAYAPAVDTRVAAMREP